MSQYGS
jgi:hypothetical protein